MAVYLPFALHLQMDRSAVCIITASPSSSVHCKKMDRDLSHANDITPETNQMWTVLVQVFERRTTKKSDAGVEYRNYMVTDTMGTKVPIVLFGLSIAFFSNTLIPFKRYYISNAIDTVTNPLYRVVEYEHTWNLCQRHLIEPYDEAIPPPLPSTFAYDRFSELYQFADQSRSICIKALIVHGFPAQTVDQSSTVRDLVVIDDEKIPMLLRVWDDLMIETDVNIYARYKVPALIVAYGLKVTTHNGLSLRTKTNAYILHNPPLNEERPLKDWFASNAASVARLLESRSYRDTSVLFRPPRVDEIVPLNTAVSSIGNIIIISKYVIYFFVFRTCLTHVFTQVKTIWTKGKLTYLPGQEKLWFEACEKCFRPIEDDVDWNIWCTGCQERTKIVVRGSVIVFLTHDGTVVEATIKSPDLEKLIPYTPKELKDAEAKKQPLRTVVEAALEKKEIICFMKFYDRPSRGTFVRRYPLMKIYTETEMQTYHGNHDNPIAPKDTGESEVILVPTPTTVEHIGSSSATTITIPKKEFFTPPTAGVLEAISKSHPTELSACTDHESAPSKRRLSFEDIQPLIEVVPNGNNSHTANHPPGLIALAPTLPADGSTTSAAKKLKGKNSAA